MARLGGRVEHVADVADGVASPLAERKLAGLAAATAAARLDVVELLQHGPRHREQQSIGMASEQLVELAEMSQEDVRVYDENEPQLDSSLSVVDCIRLGERFSTTAAADQLAGATRRVAFVSYPTNLIE